MDAEREAAVAVVLRPFEIPNGWDALVLFIRRATFDADPWSGHIALPGGRREYYDESLEETARRETFEETGIDLTAAPIIAPLPKVTPLSPVLPKISVQPYVFRYTGSSDVMICAEVAEAFWLPLSVLRRADAWRMVELMVQGTPSKVRGFTYGEHVIWGLTERVLSSLLERADLGALVRHSPK